MVRKHWYKPSFWAWWWQNRAPGGLRMTLVLGVCAVGGGAGYLLAGRISPAHASSIESTITRVELRTVTVKGATVNRTLTIREKGAVIRTTVPVVHKVVIPPTTKYLTSTIYLTRNVGYPVTTTVTVAGRSQTVIQTRTVPTVVTRTNVVTHTNVVTQQVTQQVTHQVTQTQTVVQVVTG